MPENVVCGYDVEIEKRKCPRPKKLKTADYHIVMPRPGADLLASNSVNRATPVQAKGDLHDCYLAEHLAPCISRRAYAPHGRDSGGSTVERDDAKVRPIRLARLKQFNAMNGSPQCHVEPSLRWQPVYDNHYNGCLVLPEFMVNSEEAIRVTHLKSCGAFTPAPAGG